METLATRIEIALRERPEVRLAVLFGSRAEGRERAESDADIAVGGDALDCLDLARFLSLSLDLECDVVDLEAAGYPLKKTLLDRGRVVYERQHGDGAQWRSWTIAEVETDRPWFERMRDAFLHRLASQADG